MTRDNAKREIIEMFTSKPFSQLKIGDINTIIDKIYDNFENRSCENCKYFIQEHFYGVCQKDVNTTKNQDNFLSNIEFCCNRWQKYDS